VFYVQFRCISAFTVTQFKTWLSLRTSLTQGAVCRYIWIEECSSKRIQSALMLFPFLCQLLVITVLSLYTPLCKKLFTYKTHLLGMSYICASPLLHIPHSLCPLLNNRCLCLWSILSSLKDESESLTSTFYMWVSCTYLHLSVGACFHELRCECYASGGHPNYVR
jgi:hypothetical protein